MAISATTGATVSNGSATATLAFSAANIAANQDIVVAVALADTTQTVSGIADTAGNTFVSGSAVNGTGVRVEIWEAQNVTGNASDIITISFSGATLAAAAFEEYAGIALYSGDIAPHNMTSNTLPSPYVASSTSAYNSTYYAYKAFDGNSSTWWSGTGSGVDKLTIDCGSAGSIIEYSIVGPTTGSEALKNWTLEGSNDNSSWNVIDTRSNITGWTSAQVRYFSCAVTGVAYQYFRLNITANNGSSYGPSVGELYLFKTVLSGRNIATNTANDVQPRGNVVIQEQNNWTVAALGFACQSGDTFTASDGTIRRSVVPALTSVGVALIDATGPMFASALPMSARLNTTRQWAMAGLELRGGGSNANNPNDYVGVLPLNGAPMTADYKFKGTMPSLEGTGTNTAPNWGTWTFNNGLINATFYETWQFVTPAGSTACTYAITSGALPDGLSFSQSSGVGTISGTPTTAGTYSFTLSATNTWGTTSKAFSIQINSAGGAVVSIVY